MPMVAVVPAASPFQSLKDVIAAAKKSPGTLNYAAGGGGATVTSLAAEFLKQDAGIDMLQINYKGSGPALPGVPTVAEQGLPKFEVTGWFGVLAPAGTPPAIVNRLNADLRTILAEPDVKQKLADLGLEPGGGSTVDFGKLMQAETQRATAAIQRMGLKPN